MTRKQFEAVFSVGDVVASGGLRSQLRVHNVSDVGFSAVPVDSLRQQPKGMSFRQLQAVINGFESIDPKRIEPTIQPVLEAHGLPKESTTENYLYGFARAYRARKDFALPEEIPNPNDYLEGSLSRIFVNAYERNSKARDACLKHYGTNCSVCNLSFSAVYGTIGEGYIHVHHLNLISAKKASYRIDPIRDLRPVCPNCHAMLHMRLPPYSIDELRKHLV